MSSNTTHHQQQPLTERAANIGAPSSPSSKSNSSNNTKSLFADLKSAADKEKHHQQAQSYVSPSDNILSPTTKKLSEIKGKRFANGKPQSLFARTVRREAGEVGKDAQRS